MKGVYITNYKVKGIKNLDQYAELSFYKKTITNPIDTQGYNIKGIYGMNGSGKSGIVASVKILKEMLVIEDYLSNPFVQKYLESVVNKRTRTLTVEIEYLVPWDDGADLYNYMVVLGKCSSEKYLIKSERLSVKPATSRKKGFEILFETNDGYLALREEEAHNPVFEEFQKKTINLVDKSSVSSLFLRRVAAPKEYDEDAIKGNLFSGLLGLPLLGDSIKVYMNQSDDHRNFVARHVIEDLEDEKTGKLIVRFLRSYTRNKDRLHIISAKGNIVKRELYNEYENNVEKLQEFIKIFKPELTKIAIDKRVDGDTYVCRLEMVYDDYSVDTEFESTGVKKLIELFAYLCAMAEGEIVFIDEFDANLHDVYWCALLEYLIEYGKGQLCFTTHNVGPMDVLKQNRKSLDFLSIDHKVYSWTKNGNYSPSKLYREGMIEGSPFNVDATNFIGIFDLLGDDE